VIDEDDSNRWFCEFAAHFGPTAYSAFKFILYYILILRFKRTFKHSADLFDENKLRIWISILFTWTASNIIAINITAQNISGKCEVATPPIPIMASIASIDFVACIVNTIIFSRPLFRLHRKRKSSNQKKTKQVNFKYVAIKQCILSIISVSSTIFSLLVVAMFNLYVICITFDYVVSVLCIILMYSWNSHIIDKICCCCKCCKMQIQMLKSKQLSTVINLNRLKSQSQRSVGDLKLETLQCEVTDAGTKVSSTMDDLNKSQNDEGNKNEIAVTLIECDQKSMNFGKANFEVINLAKQILSPKSVPTANENSHYSLMLRAVNSEPMLITNNSTD